MCDLVHRLMQLILALALGLLIGLLGQWLTGDEVWFLAIPCVVAIAWFRVADTQQCTRASCLTSNEANKKPAAGSPPTTGS